MDHYNWISGTTLPTPFATKLSNSTHCATVHASNKRIGGRGNPHQMDNHRFQTYPSAVWIYLIGVKCFPLFSDWPRLLPMSSRNRNWHLAARYAVFSGKSSFGFLISGCVVDLKLNTVGVCSTELNSAYCRTQ